MERTSIIATRPLQILVAPQGPANCNFKNLIFPFSGKSERRRYHVSTVCGSRYKEKYSVLKITIVSACHVSLPPISRFDTD